MNNIEIFVLFLCGEYGKVLIWSKNLRRIPKVIE